MKIPKLALVLAAAALLAGCGTSTTNTNNTAPPPTSEPPVEAPATENEPEPEAPAAGYETVAEELQAPWSIAVGEEAIYVSEREGAIVRIADGALDRQTVELQKPVHAAGEGGMLGILLSPGFEETGRLYVYHTYQESGSTLNRVVVVERTEDGGWQETEQLLEDIPGGNTHNGGRLAWGPDGMLYVSTGDAGERPLSQQEDSLAGKILRMTPEGEVPEDNPDPASYVYSSGHRNPQGLGWNADMQMYSAEHGPNAHDELNAIEAGSNYGWPDVMGDEEAAGMVPPLYHTGEETLAPSGLAVLPNGDIVVAGLRGERLARFDAEGTPLDDVLSGEGRLRDVIVSDQGLYVITNNTDGRGSPSDNDDRLLLLPLPE
ncbi:PQQ-dependent sugar dehydrogenase [Paenibacillus daejeonensis]|uniref:PQQ-dependent sugar dehydrogenase n=1 Tax=Paenibacillus daejeonensis TaxID=135193 RepID=UPI00036939B2|nr:PQQ-dependent sugar dehydrogenase [Paenibacillus daejeonensis]